MTLLFLMLSLALPTAAGYALIAIVDSERTTTTLERLPLSYALGSGLLCAYMFIIGTLGAKYSAYSLTPFFLPFAGILILKRKALLKEDFLPGFNGKTSLTGPQKAALALILLFTAWKLFFIFHGASNYYAFFTDAASTWNYKGKVIYHMSSLVGPDAIEVYGGAGAGYPLYNPLFRAWIAIMTGEWNETLINMHSVALYVSLATLFFSYLARYASLFITIVFTYALTSIPLITPHAFGSYAETSVALFLFASLGSAALWFDTKHTTYLKLSLLSAPLMAFTKNEGALLYLPVYAVTLAVFLYIKRDEARTYAKTIGIFTAICALIMAPWAIMKFAYTGGLGISGMKMEFHAEAFGKLLYSLFAEGSFGLLFASCALILSMRPGCLKNKTFLAFAFIALPALLATLSVFVFTNNYEWLRQRTTVNRTILITVPLIILCMGVFAEMAFSRGRNTDSR